MLILERYILRSYVGPFFFSMSIITFVFIMDFIIKFTDLFLEKGVALHVVLQVFALSLGHMFALIIPMAVLPATLMSFGNLASENEITAMKASGISLYHMIAPGAAAAAVLCGALIVYNSHVLPNSNHRLLNLMIDIQRKQPTVELRANQRIDDIAGYTIFFREKNDRTGEIRDVQIVKHAGRGTTPTTINAESGRLRFLRVENVLRFDLINGEIHELPARRDYSTYRRTRFRNYTINIKDIDRSLRRSKRSDRGDREMSVEMMRDKIEGIRADTDLVRARIAKVASDRVRQTFALLDATKRRRTLPEHRPVRARPSADQGVTSHQIDTTAHRQEPTSRAKHTVPPSIKRSVPWRGPTAARTKNAKPLNVIARGERLTLQEIETQQHTTTSYARQIKRYEVEIHKKFSIPFACIVFVLIGSPMAIRMGRSGMNTAIGLSILFFLVYYVCLIGGEKLADRAILGPALAMWSPNVFFGAVAVVMIRATALERTVTDWVSLFSRKGALGNDATTNSR